MRGTLAAAIVHTAMATEPQPGPKQERAPKARWLRLGKAVAQKVGEGPGPLLRAIGRTMWRSLPKGLRGGSLRRFRAVADISFREAEAGIERAGLVSVILPVYNQADLLGEAVASVLEQSYRNLELIVLDDGSRDDVGAVLAPFRGDDRLRHLRQPNQGLPKALSSAFECATGEFHTWTSADNLMHRNQLEQLVVFLRSHTDLAMVFADYELIDEAGAPLRGGDFRILDRTDPKDGAIVRVDRRVEDLHKVADNFVGGCFLYRGRASRLLGEYTPELGLEDYDYWLRMNRLLGLSHLGSRDVLYRYRVHDNTLTAKARELRLQEAAVKLLRREQRRAVAFAAPCRIVVDRACRDWVRAAAGALPVQDLEPDSLRDGTPSTLIVCAAEQLATLDLGALPQRVFVAAEFRSTQEVWRYGALLPSGRCIALARDAEVGARLLVFTRTAFVSPVAAERLELALRHQADRSFFAVDSKPEQATRAIPSPAYPRTVRVHFAGDAEACSRLAHALMALDPDLSEAEERTAQVVIGIDTCAGAAAAAARGQAYLVLLENHRELAQNRDGVPHVRAWVSHPTEFLEQVDRQFGAAPETLLWLPSSDGAAPACTHLLRWLLQGGSVPGARAHVARMMVAATS